MDIVLEAQTTALLSMAVIVTLKTIGFYYAKRMQDSTVTFDPRYAITAFFGLFTAYAAYRPNITGGTVIDIFVDAGVYAIAFNLAFDIPGKFSKA